MVISRNEMGAALGQCTVVHGSGAALSLFHPHYGLDALSAVGILIGLVDIIKVIEFHDPVYGEAPLSIVFDHLGDEYLGHRRAFDDTHNRLALPLLSYGHASEDELWIATFEGKASDRLDVELETVENMIQ